MLLLLCFFSFDDIFQHKISVSCKHLTSIISNYTKLLTGFLMMEDSTDLKFCCHLVYCYIFQFFLVRIRDAECFTYSSKRFSCKLMFKNVLLMNTSCSHLHSFCVIGMIRSLANSVPLFECHGGDWERVLHGGTSTPVFMFIL
jgi:hypothetical protein